jgi:hypothetical protein
MIALIQVIVVVLIIIPVSFLGSLYLIFGYDRNIDHKPSSFEGDD